MKLGILFSGGKDSTYALFLAMQKETVTCLITIISQNKESFMFHTPNIELTKLQAEAIGLPYISQVTAGEKEEELTDLKNCIKSAKEEYGIEGIVTGAVASVYQTTRVQKICNELDLWCFNPLWQKEQIELLNEIVENGFDVIITGVFAEPLDRTWLGRRVDNKTISELRLLREQYHISPSGEGGEFETTVLDAPFFKKKIVIIDSSENFLKNSGTLKIKRAVLKEK